MGGTIELKVRDNVFTGQLDSINAGVRMAQNYGLSSFAELAGFHGT